METSENSLNTSLTTTRISRFNKEEKLAVDYKGGVLKKIFSLGNQVGFFSPMEKSKIISAYNAINIKKMIEDKELIKTVEKLFAYDLNVSLAAKSIFIHRNTMNYRIEKIKNLTELDIKKFEDAIILKNLLEIYKNITEVAIHK